MAPVDAEQALAAHVRRAVQIALEAVNVELRQPHGGVVLQPGNGPALAAFQFAEDLVYRVPAQRIAETGEDNVARQASVEVREMARHAAPSGHHQILAGRVAAQEI